jgi:protein TonB
MGQLAKGIQPLPFDLSASAFQNLHLGLPQTDLQTRFQAALAVSFMLHLLIVVGVTIRPPERGKLSKESPQLEVVLVNSRSATAPAKADALAQANLDGGGNADADRRAKSPLPVMKRDAPVPKLAVQTRKAKARKQDTQKPMTQSREPAPAVVQPEPKNQDEPVTESVQAPNTAGIVSRSLEMARLEAQIAKNWDTYEKRPRRRFIGARTQEFRFARYVEDWRIKIERIGTLNYPQAARDQRIFGMLQLTVAIRPDGSVESVEINRPSGQPILDKAALRIVRLAAPFAAFPPDIAKDTDILSITRTWSFTRSDRFQAE